MNGANIWNLHANVVNRIEMPERPVANGSQNDAWLEMINFHLEEGRVLSMGREHKEESGLSIEKLGDLNNLEGRKITAAKEVAAKGAPNAPHYRFEAGDARLLVWIFLDEAHTQPTRAEFRWID